MSREQAVTLLTHYLSLPWEAAGLGWDSDNAGEVEQIIDALLDEVADRARAHVEDAPTIPAAPAAPTNAEVEAAARAMHFPNLWKALTNDARDVLRRSARAALTAAAEVRAGVAR